MQPPPSAQIQPYQITVPQPPDPLETVRKMQEIRLRNLEIQQRQEEVRAAAAIRESERTAPTLNKSGDAPASAAASGSAPLETDGQTNCRGWQTAPDAVRDGYTVGFAQGTLLGLSLGGGPEKAQADMAATIIPQSATYGEARKAIDTICAAPENAVLPIANAFMLFTARLRGATVQTIEEMAANFRRIIATPVTSDKK
jgi:hypothetical protein